MSIEVSGFDWNEWNLRKLAKHKVTQEEAEELFYVAPFIDEGAYEKKGEKRYRCLGITASGRFLAAFFAIRDGQIRVITVRSMRKKERKLYDTQKAH